MSKITYIENYPGLNKDGSVCDVPVTITVDKSDAIKISRYAMQQHYTIDLGNISEERLLSDFIAVHWTKEE